MINSDCFSVYVAKSYDPLSVLELFTLRCMKCAQAKAWAAWVVPLALLTWMAWFEAIIHTAARQIAISSEINIWKYFITWCAGKGIRCDPSSSG